MIRFALVLALSLPAAGAFAAPAGCSVSGTAYDAAGTRLDNAVVRLVDLDTRQAAFSAVDRHAMFAFDHVAAGDGGRYRIDLVSAPVLVTGSHIPVRSVLGMSPQFACAAGQLAHQDVHAQVE
jgi:hypothetical protein